MTELEEHREPAESGRDRLSGFLQDRAQRLERWAGKESSKQEVAIAAVLSACGVLVAGAAMEHGPAMVDKAKQIAEFAGNALDYIVTEVDKTEPVDQIVIGVVERTMTVASQTGFAATLRAGQEVFDSPGRDVGETVAAGAGFILGAGTTVGAGVYGIADERRRHPKISLRNSTLVVPAVVRVLKMVARVTESKEEK